MWSKFDVKATTTAIDQLSGDAFKLWAKLALNQDGYSATLHQNQYALELEELLEKGYFIQQENDDFHFAESGSLTCADENIPASWCSVYTLYYPTMKDSYRDLEYVRGRLNSAHLADEIDAILNYWSAHFSELDSSRPGNAKNHLRYDFSKVLIWYLWDHFTFKLGDVVELGRDGGRLRFHHDETKGRIVDGAKANNLHRVELKERNLDFWVEAFSKRRIELRPDDIGQILLRRRMHG